MVDYVVVPILIVVRALRSRIDRPRLARHGIIAIPPYDVCAGICYGGARINGRCNIIAIHIATSAFTNILIHMC